LPKLQLKSMSEFDAITNLSIASSADKEHRGRLKTVLRYMEDAGLIKSEDENISLGQRPDIQPEEEIVEPKLIKVTESNVVNSSPLSKGSTVMGDGIQLNFSISVDAKEISTWAPERITALLHGLAKVLSAKAALDQEAEK
jgi:hypothetical protein